MPIRKLFVGKIDRSLKLELSGEKGVWHWCQIYSAAGTAGKRVVATIGWTGSSYLWWDGLDLGIV